MPHVPSQYASSSGISPAAVPAAAKQTAAPAAPASYPGLKKISPLKHKPNLSQVFKTLYGEEAPRDEYTGGYVLSNTARSRS